VLQYGMKTEESIMYGETEK